MLRFYYNPFYKYTNRTIIDVTGDDNFTEHDYENIDSPDTINGHIIYQLSSGEQVPTYVVDTTLSKKWFVSGITQLRTGKFQLSLLRDIISEAPLLWKGEQAYISAGTAPNGDFCKYKKWDLPFTNTKVGTQRLNINGKSSFFVFYVNEQKYSSNVITEKDLEIGYTTLPGISTYDIALSDLNEIPHFDYVGAGDIYAWDWIETRLTMEERLVYGNNNYGGARKYVWRTNVFQKNDGTFDFQSATPYETSVSNNYLSTNIRYTEGTHNTGTAGNNYVSTGIKSLVENALPNIETDMGIQTESMANIAPLDAYAGKIIKIPDPNNPGQDLFYRINRNLGLASTGTIDVSKSDTSPFINYIKQNPSSPLEYFPYWSSTPSPTGNSYFSLKGRINVYNYTLEFLGEATAFTFNFKGDTRKLPKSAVRCVNIVSDEDIDDKLISQCLMLAQANSGNDTDGVSATTGRIIDVQYLPFSIATQKNTNFDFSGVYATAEFLDTDDFIYTTTLPNLTNINKETDSVMIVSPTRKSQFKFSPYNNDGIMTFNTKITIRPNQSVIYVRPSTQGLLMQDWDDKECLIIQEDFSLTTINSAWTNYVYNNRNYQNAFNLQIQTKEFERTWERRIEQEQAKSDELTARNISAQKAQAYTGNLPIVSGIASAIGTAWADDNYMKMAQLDREYNEALYQKSIEVARTQFTYQLDNVKSQPLIPNTITAIDVKLLDGVYLEFYSTNPTELTSIQQFYYYNGNRIDNYGTFGNYWGNFVRGKIIISNNYTQPEVDELNRRLELGVFTGE